MVDSPQTPNTNSEKRLCFARLGLGSSATVHEVTEAYRKLAARCHPDAGGDVDEFNALESAYRECLRHAANRPKISGRPSSDNFFPRLPGSLYRLISLPSLLIIVLVFFPCLAWWDWSLVITAAAFFVPLLLGCLLSQISFGAALLVAGGTLLSLGLAWIAAIYRVGWLSYAFVMVPSQENADEFVLAVGPEKHFWLIVAAASTALTVVMVAVGVLVSLSQNRR